MTTIASGILMIVALSMPSAYAASIYKCTKKDGTVIFTDKECGTMPMRVIHTETAEEVQRRLYTNQVATLKQLISSGQTVAAKEYAEKNNLQAVFQQESENYKLAQAQKAQEEKQAAEQLRQQQLLLQKQQLELENQQLAIDKAKSEQQQRNTVYPLYRTYSHDESVPVISQPVAGVPAVSRPVPAPVNSQPIATMPMNPPNNPVTSTGHNQRK
jgi:hypothetical protein